MKKSEHQPPPAKHSRKKGRNPGLRTNENAAKRFYQVHWVG
ncbi:hypothetical protein B4168_3171 [Anoxybacillus flavithermus]|nr:hypothetical protein B4168_3171 [Anoxybacillus flavithermus]OAO88377.1 hypothetical protein GT23_0345 [Parageobacillus thermoglucosidasius]